MTEHWYSQATRLQNTVENTTRANWPRWKWPPLVTKVTSNLPMDHSHFRSYEKECRGGHNHKSSTILRHGLPLIANNFTPRIVTGISDIPSMSLHPSTRHISVKFIFRSGGISERSSLQCVSKVIRVPSRLVKQTFTTASATASLCCLTSADR
jgi:hypothetical protein